MVKFSKQLEAQLTTEWRFAFCDYWQLKKDIKQIKLQGKKRLTDASSSAIFSRSLSRWRSGLSHQDGILVHKRISANEEELYETVFLKPRSHSELEKAFFRRLDEELNKVNRFYKDKENEYVQRKEELIKQLLSFLELQEAYEVSHKQQHSSEHLSKTDTEAVQENNSSGISMIQDIGYVSEKAIKHESKGETTKGTDDNAYIGSETHKEEERYCHLNWQKVTNSIAGKIAQVKLDIPNSTPALTISALTNMIWNEVPSQSKSFITSWSDDETINRKKLHHAKKLLRTAFIDCYHGLSLLKNFSSLNMVAFAKTLKKYEKVTGQHVAHIYLENVERSYFQSSKQVPETMQELEKAFTKYFADSNHRKAMSYLRPSEQKASHIVTFFLGLFTGCSLALLAAFGILLHADGFYRSRDSSQSGQNLYMSSVYPAFSMLSLILLHMYMYGWNIFIWRQVRINYAFIFEISPNMEIKYREVLLVCTGLTTVVMGGMLAHLAAHTRASGSPRLDIIPMVVILVFLLLLLCPFNVCYYSSRMFFLRSMKHIILSPLYKVVMVDFFIADQLTSQVPMLRNAEHVMCYYFGGHFLEYHISACTGKRFHFAEFSYPISMLPYWWRLMQCFRRWIDEGDPAHIVNGGKYFSAMVALGARLTYLNRGNPGWLFAFVISSVVSTIYQLYWDLVVDWGLLRRNSRNPWLRDQLILKRKYVYYMSMVLNIILRFAWLQSVMRIRFGKLDYRITDFIFASFEVVRRGHWNFYRLENEHLNNVGKFRAVKMIPLPFRYADESEV